MDVRTCSETEFDALAARQLGDERYGIFARWRTEPVFFSRTADAWILTRFDDVRAVLVADEDFRPLETGPGAPVYGRTFLQMSGTEHSPSGSSPARRTRSRSGPASTSVSGSGWPPRSWWSRCGRCWTGPARSRAPGRSRR